jgi:hypothetical protein
MNAEVCSGIGGASAIAERNALSQVINLNTTKAKAAAALRMKFLPRDCLSNGKTAVFDGVTRLHGFWGKPEWNSWNGAKSRCYSLGDISYKNYSARGIVVCERWRNSFIAFIEDMGQMPPSPPRYTIDRIDNEGHYSCGKCDECKANSWPMNCRWATYKEQMNNRRKQRFWRGRPVKVT